MTTTTPSAPPVDRDYPLTPVPPDARRSAASMTVLVIGFLFFTPTMLAAGQVSTGFDFASFLWLAGIAAAVLAGYIGLLAAVSARTGLTTVLVARSVFGVAGGKWASVLLGGTQIGWYGITLATLADLMGRALGLETTWPIAVIGGVLMAVTAYVGIGGIELLSWISVPLMLALCVWVFVLAVDETGGLPGLLAAGGGDGLSAGAAITVMIGTFVSGGTQIGNWTRFARSGRAAFAGTLGAVLTCQFLMLAFGGVGAAAFGEGDFAELLVGLGLIGPGLILLVANLWTTNDNAAYAYGVAGSELFGRADKRPFVLAGTAIGIVIAVSGLGGMLVPFLGMLGVLIPPLGGAILGTYFLAWRGRLPGDAAASLVRPSGAIAYLAGVAAALVGSIADLGSPAVQGIIVAAVVAPAVEALRRRADRSAA